MTNIDTIREALIKLRAFAKGLDCDYQEECTPDDDDMCQSCRHVYIAEQAIAALSAIENISTGKQWNAGLDIVRNGSCASEESVYANLHDPVTQACVANLRQWKREIERSALSTIDPEAETGWMIEKSSGIPMWWRGLPKREGSDSWSIDPLQGIRFARKVDAEVCALAQGYKLSAVRATDHRWG